MRFFNTEGPVRPDDHYAVPPLDRMDVDELLTLIRAKRYFVLHAPRQTGKTSALIALRDLLNSGKVGNFRCVHTNVEAGQVARDDVAEGIRAILSMMNQHNDLPVSNQSPSWGPRPWHRPRSGASQSPTVFSGHTTAPSSGWGCVPAPWARTSSGRLHRSARATRR